MPRFTSLLALLSIGALAGAASVPEDCPPTGVSVIAHSGDPVGKEQVHEGINILADSFGRAGYLTVAPDLFNGTPAPGDINGRPDFNVTKFLDDHRPEVTDPIIETAIDFLRTKLGVKKVVATGYCFGGRYTFRFLAEGKGVDVGFAAHPSLLEDAEISALNGPASIAAADADDMTPPARRSQIEALLLETGFPYSLALYGGTQHGFGVRANVSDPKQKFGKEEAFFQAIRWFNAWA
ncbi:hypothetical protein Daesc_005568 [Daldinia eschscholtzii]|uniref:Dienelactone hydrolase domain-containing protein n=1 Tax=Daldinia eschscholtzii TaxID=292717 RepID=A0AAX6MLI5_9PEZI